MIAQFPRLHSAQDLAVQMDLDEDAATLLFQATGGWSALITSALKATTDSSFELSDILNSAGLADFVVSGLAELAPPLDSADMQGLEVLSLLHGFDEATASVALDGAHGELSICYRARSVRTITNRLQVVGAVLAVDGEDRLVVPPLVAAWVRSVPSSTEVNRETGRLHRALAKIFTDQIEIAKKPHPLMVDNALCLARSSRAWHLLDRIGMAVGLPLFYLHPQTSIDIFTELPAGVRRRFPMLGTFSALAESISSAQVAAGRSGNPGAFARSLVAEFTAPHMSVVQTLIKPLTDNADPATSPRPVEEPGEVLALMQYHGDRGDHDQAAELGSQWTYAGAAMRPLCLVKLQATVHSVHSGNYSHALALIDGIDNAVKETAVAGDCLQPAVVAWTALASYFSGDHRRTDSELTCFAALDTPPLIVEASFRPAVLVATAYRCLDRLDVKSATVLLTTMRKFPDMGDLWVHVPVIERRLALLTADSEASLLLADETVEVYSRGKASTNAGNHILTISRASALIVQGRWRDADVLVDSLPDSIGMKHVLLALSELLAGHHAETIALVDSYDFQAHLDTRERMILTSLNAVAYLQANETQLAHETFKEALELSVWAGSLLPIATLPAAQRQVLLRAVNEETIWTRLLTEFSSPDVDVESFRRKLEEAAPVVRAKENLPQLDAREFSLLELLDRGKSISEIGNELHLVDGTVKNKLSALYRKLSVHNRASAVAKSKALGILGLPKSEV